MYGHVMFEVLVSKGKERVKNVDFVTQTLYRSQIFSDRSSDAVAKYLHTNNNVACLKESIKKKEPSTS